MPSANSRKVTSRTLTIMARVSVQSVKLRVMSASRTAPMGTIPQNMKRLRRPKILTKSNILILGVQDHLPKLLALFQTLVGGCGLVHGKALVHHGLQLAGKDVLHHLVKVAHGAHERP